MSLRTTIAAIAGLLVWQAAPAQNLGFLERSPVAYLTPEDKEILADAFHELLSEHADGETVEWRNERTGHFGSLTVLDTHDDLGTTCRTVRARTTAGGIEGGGRYRLCLAEDGSWVFAPLRRRPPKDGR